MAGCEGERVDKTAGDRGWEMRSSFIQLFFLFGEISLVRLTHPHRPGAVGGLSTAPQGPAPGLRPPRWQECSYYRTRSAVSRSRFHLNVNIWSSCALAITGHRAPALAS